jgi:hypothetical protein
MAKTTAADHYVIARRPVASRTPLRVFVVIFSLKVLTRKETQNGSVK